MKFFLVLMAFAMVARAQGPAAAPDPAQVRKFVENVCLGKPSDLTLLWVTSPSVVTYGANLEERAAVEAAVAEINGALEGTPIQLILAPAQAATPEGTAPDGGNVIHLHFGNTGDLSSVARFLKLQRNDLTTRELNWWNDDHSLNEVGIFIDRTKVSPQRMQWRATTDLLVAIGFWGRPKVFKAPIDSIFYGNEINTLRPLDIQLVRFYYLHAKPGMRGEAVRKMVNTFWDSTAAPK